MNNMPKTLFTKKTLAIGLNHGWQYYLILLIIFLFPVLFVFYFVGILPAFLLVFTIGLFLRYIYVIKRTNKVEVNKTISKETSLRISFIYALMCLVLIGMNKLYIYVTSMVSF